jgi:hypothetical protein
LSVGIKIIAMNDVYYDIQVDDNRIQVLKFEEQEEIDV